MKKIFWLLLGLAPIGIGFIDWRGSGDGVLLLLLTVTAVGCLLSAFALLEGTIRNVAGRIVLSLVLGAALLALDFSVAFAVGCSLYPFKLG